MTLQEQAGKALEERRRRGEKAKHGRREKARERARDLARQAVTKALGLDPDGPVLKLRLLDRDLSYPPFRYTQDGLDFDVRPQTGVRGAPQHYNVFLLLGSDDEDEALIERLADLGEALAR